MNKSGEFFVHLRIGPGAATLACMMRGDLVDVGVSLCAPNDQFSRKLGRRIAQGRRLRIGGGERQYLRAFTFALPSAGDRPLRDIAVEAFRKWMMGAPWRRPLWWPWVAVAPIELWPGKAPQRGARGRRA